MDKIIRAYFKDFDIEDLVNIIKVLVYENPVIINDDNTGVLIEKFLKEQGLMELYLKIQQQRINPPSFFRLLSQNEIELFNELQSSLLSCYFQMTKNNVNVSKQLEELNVKLTKTQNDIKEYTKLESKLKFAKNTAITILSNLNEHDSYFYGKDEDLKLTQKLQKL